MRSDCFGIRLGTPRYLPWRILCGVYAAARLRAALSFGWKFHKILDVWILRMSNDQHLPSSTLVSSGVPNP